MSSFLMNPQQYVDPKFPPSEEYSQGNYMPDYYSQHHQQHYGGFHAYAAENGTAGYANTSPHGYYNPCSLGQNCISDHLTADDSLHHQSHNNRSSPDSSPPPAGSILPRSDTQGSDCSASEPPVIYPWMKKVHSNQGKSNFPHPHRKFFPKFTQLEKRDYRNIHGVFQKLRVSQNLFKIKNSI